MIVEERMIAFINSFDKGNPPILEEIEKRALEDEIPIIRKDTQSFLKFVLALQRPVRILEIGCAVGFSALLMCEYAPEKAHITTIENYRKRIAAARANFQRAGREEAITLLEGDAALILPELSGEFDMIFMDAAKGQYLAFLPHVLRLLAPGGLLISDNVLQEGDILQSRYAVARRDRTIHSRMREYLYVLTHHEELESCILPVGDGLALSVRLTAEQG